METETDEEGLFPMEGHMIVSLLQHFQDFGNNPLLQATVRTLQGSIPLECLTIALLGAKLTLGWQEK